MAILPHLRWPRNEPLHQPFRPLPTPKPDQHLVKVLAAALNPVDYKPAEIPGVARFAITKPATPGIDFAGTLVQPAAGSSLEPGQLVFGSCGTSVLAGGALREFSVSGVKSTCAIPDGVDPVDAATIGVAGLTAYQSIVPHVKSGDKVFINGGSGGTGVFGIQIAKAVGCHVTTTCSTANVEFCRTLGADRVIDYKQETVLDVLLKADGPEFDHAVDNVGSDEQLPLQCHKFLRPGALFIIVGGGGLAQEPDGGPEAHILARFPGRRKGERADVLAGAQSPRSTADCRMDAGWKSQGGD